MGVAAVYCAGRGAAGLRNPSQHLGAETPVAHTVHVRKLRLRKKKEWAKLSQLESRLGWEFRPILTAVLGAGTGRHGLAKGRESQLKMGV